MADNLANDDLTNPSISGEINNLLNKYPPPGGSAPVNATSTTAAGKSGTSAATVEIITPGKRTQNPLANFSSYTYQISLYMITPDAYSSFVLGGRKNLDSIVDITTTAQTARNATTSNNAPTRTGGVANGNTGSPPSLSSPTPTTGGVYLIAQSGGINNTNSKRAPGFELDFYIDDLKIEQAISTKEVGAPTNFTKATFNITEPYGFSLLTKLRRAQTSLATVTNTPNFDKVQDPVRQIYILGIRFLGYDKNGNIIEPSTIPDSVGDPFGNAFGLYERFYDIIITELKFKIAGKAVVYNIAAGNASSIIAFGSKFGSLDQDVNIQADTVYNALMGGAGAGLRPGENPNTVPAAGGMIGLLSKLNFDQQQLVGKGALIAREYDVVFIGPNSDSIKNAKLVSLADLDKRKVPTTSAVTTSKSNEKAAQSNGIKSDVRTIKLAKGTMIIQAVNDIIKQSQYMESALSTIAQTALTTDTDTNGIISSDKKDNPTPISWYNISAEVINLGWDINQGDYVYKITYIIQPYLTPVVVAASARVIPNYYGPHKRYEYWFTGKNSEIVSYDQQINYAFFNVTITGSGVGSAAQGGATDIPLVAGKQQDASRIGRSIAYGMEDQNAYMTSLFGPNDWGEAKIKILGDPDYLMQPAPSSINDLYNQFYGTDRFTINPNGGQVFIEINFNEPQDYHNDTGLLSVNNSIYFFNYPESIQKSINSRGGGISYMVKTVTSSFSKGKFQQDLVCSLNTFTDPKTDTNQPDGSDNRFGRQGQVSTPGTNVSTTTTRGTAAGTMGAYVSRAPIPSGTGTTSSPMRSAPNPTTTTSFRGGPMIKQNQQSTVPTKQGPVQSDDAGYDSPL